MRFDHLKSLYLSILVFFLSLTSGYFLSQHKTLWFDELYTQNSAIEPNSYLGILSLKFPDGNKNPLFYTIQKAVCNTFSFHLSPRWLGYSFARDMRAEIILRIQPNIYMSLALAIFFYFFTRFYSIYAALFAMSVALVSPMIWTYWVEARPYSLWFLLTTIQLLLVCTSFIAPKIRICNKIFFTQLLLALTTPTSLIQISIISFFLLFKKKVSLKQAAFVWVIPFGVALFYYFMDTIAKVRTYDLTTNLFENVMPEHLYIYVIYATLAWVVPDKHKKFFGNAFFLPVFLVFLASALFILLSDVFTHNSTQGFFSRYIIYLTPADILMFVLVSFDLRQWSRQNPWFCMNMSIIIGGFVITRGLMTYREILATALYLHSPG